MTLPSPFVKFHQLLPSAPPPRRADSTLFGSIPLRAHRHCEPFTAAAGFGFHLFPPMDFILRWDGSTVFWTHPNASGWLPLKAAEFPGFEDHWNTKKPAGMKAIPLPFLMAIREPGIVQLWTGVIARTSPDWRLLVRAPANLPRSVGYEVLEGIVETDWWFGPILSNIRICRTDEPLLFRKQDPIFQVQLVHQAAYSDKTLDGAVIESGVESLTQEDWVDLDAALGVRTPRPGGYKAEVRRRRKQPGS